MGDICLLFLNLSLLLSALINNKTPFPLIGLSNTYVLEFSSIYVE